MVERFRKLLNIRVFWISALLISTTVFAHLFPTLIIPLPDQPLSAHYREKTEGGLRLTFIDIEMRYDSLFQFEADFAFNYIGKESVDSPRQNIGTRWGEVGGKATLFLEDSVQDAWTIGERITLLVASPSVPDEVKSNFLVGGANHSMRTRASEESFWTPKKLRVISIIGIIAAFVMAILAQGKQEPNSNV